VKFGSNVLYINVSIEGVGFSSWRPNFKMAAMTSFHSEKCRHLASVRAPLCSSTSQFWSVIHY